MVLGFSNWNILNNVVNDLFYVWYRVMWMVGCIVVMLSVTYFVISAFVFFYVSVD